MFKLKGKSLYVKLALNVCLTAAAGNRPNQYTAKPTPLAVLVLQEQGIQYKYVSLLVVDRDTVYILNIIVFTNKCKG